MTEPETIRHDADQDRLEALEAELAELRQRQDEAGDPFSPGEREALERTEARIRRHLEDSERNAKETGRQRRPREAVRRFERLMGEVEETVAQIPRALDALAASGVEDETVADRLMLLANEADELTRYVPDPAKAPKAPTVKTTVRNPVEAMAGVNARHKAEREENE